jgi:hypothetical protein
MARHIVLSVGKEAIQGQRHPFSVSEQIIRTRNSLQLQNLVGNREILINLRAAIDWFRMPQLSGTPTLALDCGAYARRKNQMKFHLKRPPCAVWPSALFVFSTLSTAGWNQTSIFRLTDLYRAQLMRFIAPHKTEEKAI